MEHCDGEGEHNRAENTFVWRIPSVTADNSSGSLEFSLAGDSADEFFPVRVTFTSPDLMCPIALQDVVHEDDLRSVRHATGRQLRVQTFTVE